MKIKKSNKPQKLIFFYDYNLNKNMKLRYLIPIIGYFLISYDIPHTEDQRPYKPLQGDEAFSVMTAVSIINVFYILLFVLLLKSTI